ncbi:hypothetical protein ACFQX8_19145 [Klenkia terrae]|uniref:hypothetical protein n=1 Tax=Klenkia terrae TaxID=1052259 RepID=UPI0036066628
MLPDDVELVMSPWMSPGSVAERLFLFAASCSAADRSGAGGGLVEEEAIEVRELPYPEALAQVREGRIDDAETVLLLQWPPSGSVPEHYQPPRARPPRSSGVS